MVFSLLKLIELINTNVYLTTQYILQWSEFNNKIINLPAKK